MKDNLERLKQQVQKTSNQQYQIQKQKEELKDELDQKQNLKLQNEKEMTQFIQSVFGRSELANERDRQLLQEKIDRFSHRQQIMNENIIALNDNLMDTTSLEELYATKRKELELNYLNQKKSLENQINTLTKHVEDLEQDIHKKNMEFNQISIQIKKATFWYNFKKFLIDKWLVFAIVGFIFLIIGGFAGWSVFSLFESFFGNIKNII